MQTVESSLARVGQTCNSRVLDRVTRNATTSRSHNRERDAQRYTFASQLSVLRNCPIVMSRLMKGEASYLLTAKVLVISRLLHKALSQEKSGQSKPEIVDQLRDRLGSLRGKLLRGIDRRLAAPSKSGKPDVEVLVETMCAYSLATSSTPTDVLRHFHHVRTEEIVGALRPGEGLKEHGISALKLCLQTCQDTISIFPRRLADALAKLKVQPLIQDSEVRALYELNLDVHERWIGDEARNYTPQPRHNELQRPEAENVLHHWSRQTIQAFLKGIGSAIEDTKQLREVAELRQELIETWILAGSRMAGVKSKNVLDNLRDTMNEHLETIMRSRAQDCRAVAEQIMTTLANWEDKHTIALTLWTSIRTPTDLQDGAGSFKQNMLNTHQGRDDAVIRVLSTYDNWIDSILEVKGIVKSMKETRWDDPFSDDIDLDDSDDEFGNDSKQTLLSDDDPRLLEEATQEAVEEALTSLGKSFEKIVDGLRRGQESVQMVPKMIFVLRVVREVNDRISKLKINDKVSPPPYPFARDSLAVLHAALATQIVAPLIESYRNSLNRVVKAKSKSHVLWEGQPPLPVQPSSDAFRLLSDLVKSMAAHGSDLWAPEGVQVLKKIASSDVVEVWTNVFEAINATPTISVASETPVGDDEEKPQAETHESRTANHPDDMESQRAQKLKQLLLDILYVQRNLSTESEQLLESVFKAADVDENGKARLKKSAGDYARKTYLLFALLG